jgi:YidC/Oxa1 family membrane protein insertase
MDSTRIIAAIALAISVFLLFDAWGKANRPPTQIGTNMSVPTGSGSSAVQSLPVAGSSNTPVVADASKSLQKGRRITIKTDLISAEVDTVGGDLRRVELLEHRDTFDPSKGFLLFKDEGEPLFVVQSGLAGENLPNHKTPFREEFPVYVLKEGAERLDVRLTSDVVGGVQLIKTYQFKRASYVVDVTMQVLNQSGQGVAPVAYFQLLRDSTAAAGESSMVPTFTGVGLYTDESKYKKLSFSDLDKGKSEYPQHADNGWIGFVQHYFLGAWIPEPKTARDYYAQGIGSGLYRAGFKLTSPSVANGQSVVFKAPLYVGPQEQDKLSKLAPGLELTVDYGWLTVIASPLFWVLSSLYRFLGNWGLAIIALTVLIKAVFYPLSAASYRSMAKMRVLAPKMQKLKEQFGDDRQKMQQAMMELYKTEKINPFGGCLPILVQIPVFIALYWALLGSVELRHAPFFGWIHDLSIKDPFYVLPVLMGLTMIIQTRLNPEPPDPVQAKVMKIMPIIFSVFFFFFPAGLVLYWLVNNVLSIGQQWLITRGMEQADATRSRR